MPSLSRKKITIKKMGGVVPIPAPTAIPVPAPPPLDKKLISSDSKANTGLLRKMYEEAVGAGLLKIDSK